MKKIIKNAIRCKKCNDIIESKTVHDLVSCKCGCCSVDGGKQYARRTFTNSIDDYEELSEFIEVPDLRIEDLKNNNKDIPITIR